MKRFDVVIAGAGHAGAQVAIALRQRNFAGSILLLSGEPFPPYERPPLSKEYLAGKKQFERILLRPPSFWPDRQIELQLASPVMHVEPRCRTVTTENGESIGYVNLVWAAGGKPRSLSCPGADLSGIHLIRTKEGVDRLIQQFDAGARRVLVVGGGYIGLEATAVLNQLGAAVSIVETQERLLSRVAGMELSRFYEREHRRRGVDIRFGETVERFEGAAGAVSAAVLSSGERLVCNLVIVGIGIEPCVAPLVAAGAHGAGGVEVDADCRTTLPEVYAVGDCAVHANRYAGGASIRLESVQNARDMAETAAASICGNPQPYDALPWFWSNQYDLKLQTIGLSIGHDTHIVRGNPDDRSFSVLYLRSGRVIALDCVNAVKDYVQGRILIEGGMAVDPDALSDRQRPLKELALTGEPLVGATTA
jgi:3-phenylpropionate/trans-cinnamate dioxygenase ferredoxin reductase subunit